jgi:hypothetical protein
MDTSLLLIEPMAAAGYAQAQYEAEAQTRPKMTGSTAYPADNFTNPPRAQNVTKNMGTASVGAPTPKTINSYW